MKADVVGPFGDACYLRSLSTSHVAKLYAAKCGAEVQSHFGGVRQLDLFECKTTGYRFWRPQSVAGTESFYQLLGMKWKEYYRPWRWEYDQLLPLLQPSHRLLEVGCGRGYFLRSTEQRIDFGVGLELNSEAIANRVTSCEIRASTIEEEARVSGQSFDIVCSFQVLEHVVDPAKFLRGCLDSLKPGGFLAISAPNRDYSLHARGRDAFDFPPHHMGQFSPSVFQRIADLYDLRVRQLVNQQRHFHSQTLINWGMRSRVLKPLNFGAERILNTYYRITGKPGPGTFVVFQKQ